MYYVPGTAAQPVRSDRLVRRASTSVRSTWHLLYVRPVLPGVQVVVRSERWNFFTVTHHHWGRCLRLHVPQARGAVRHPSSLGVKCSPYDSYSNNRMILYVDTRRNQICTIKRLQPTISLFIEYRNILDRGRHCKMPLFVVADSHSIVFCYSRASTVIAERFVVAINVYLVESPFTLFQTLVCSHYRVE